jgi:formylglycine-generating enzyme required for sulfatase activity
MKDIKPLLALSLTALLTVLNPGVGQAQSTLHLELYAGVTITGAVGTVYAIQGNTNLANTNGWSCVAFVKPATTNYLWNDNSAPATGRRFYRAVSIAPTNLVFIPPGTFLMGSPTNEVDRESDEGPQTLVTISRGFLMGKYEVTQSEYLAVMGSNPSFFTTNSQLPVERVTWSNATNYCAKRTTQELASGLIPAGSKYRLPTEAEWEYACRAGTIMRFSWGDDLGYTLLENYAWYGANSGGSYPNFFTHLVGLKPANAWGLHDMNGNVWERCLDWWATALPGGSVTDPTGPSSGVSRILRGGWYSDYTGQICRSASRNGSAGTLSAFGFRVVLAPGQP